MTAVTVTFGDVALHFYAVEEESMFGRTLHGASFVIPICMSLHAASGATVAVIGGDAQAWCDLLATDGHVCVTFPPSGPDTSLTPFDVVIDLSSQWADPTGLLADRMRAGAGVITWHGAPSALGISSDPTVQAWIGANESTIGSGFYESVTEDPVLGNTQPGTALGNCNDFPCGALRDTSGHPNAKVLAAFPFPYDSIAILRNEWGGGRSVYLTFDVLPEFSPGPEWILNAVRELAVPPPVPAASHWGLVILALLLISAASVLIRWPSGHHCATT